MINFKETLNKELNHITPAQSSSQIVSKSKQKKPRISYIPRFAAAAIVLILLVGICFTPSNLNNPSNNGFIITAGAKELSSDAFAVINSDESNYIKFNFNYILNKKANSTDIAKKYLFYSFEKTLGLKIVGKDIDTITYKINNGSLSAYNYTPTDDGGSITQIKNTYSKLSTKFTINYDEQDNWTFAINSSHPNDDFYYRNTNYFVLADTGEVTTYKELKTEETPDPIAYGYKDDSTPLATLEEIEKLQAYISADNMTGFYNYQNSIFKRLIDEITIDVTVTKYDGSTETKKLQLCYTPIEVKSSDSANDNHSYTLSNGTISAKIIVE